MVAMTLTLSAESKQKLEELSRRTGKTVDELANEAIKRLDAGTEEAAFQEWRAALLRIEGMWQNRDDLPDFEQVRRSMDRDPWSR